MKSINLSRENMYFSQVAFVASGNILKTRNIIFGTEEHLNLKNDFLSTNIVDINYETPNYPYIIKNNLIPTQIGILPDKTVWISPLLNSFGFDKILNEQTCEELMMTLFNGKFPYDYCELFGVARKINSCWKNGTLNRRRIKEGKYEFSNYEVVDKNCVLVDYFTLLTLNINALNPYRSFLPLEEEAPIRKRILK